MGHLFHLKPAKNQLSPPHSKTQNVPCSLSPSARRVTVLFSESLPAAHPNTVMLGHVPGPHSMGDSLTLQRSRHQHHHERWHCGRRHSPASLYEQHTRHTKRASVRGPLWYGRPTPLQRSLWVSSVSITSWCQRPSQHPPHSPRPANTSLQPRAGPCTVQNLVPQPLPRLPGAMSCPT